MVLGALSSDNGIACNLMGISRKTKAMCIQKMDSWPIGPTQTSSQVVELVGPDSRRAESGESIQAPSSRRSRFKTATVTVQANLRHPRRPASKRYPLIQFALVSFPSLIIVCRLTIIEPVAEQHLVPVQADWYSEGSVGKLGAGAG